MPYFLRVKPDQSAPPIEFLTIGELAGLCGKSKDALKKLTDRGILPDANFRTPRIEIKRGEGLGKTREGYRLYSKDVLIPKLVPYIKKNFKRGILITRDQRLELLNMFREEREQLITK